MKRLPDLLSTHIDYATDYAETVFNDDLIAVQPQPDNVHRALFASGYFTIQPGNDKPSRSQWNTLKKRMKRINRGAFILREYGTTTHQDETVYYIDFGFLPERR